ncbi:MAG: DNA polymerase III subunit beta [Duncaniella sp.]|nr:DNA polymerase III subunit beta [Duncaniella sp.]
MRFTVPSKKIYSFASAVSKVINAKNNLTILNNFLFSIEGETLVITASDGENTLRGRVEILDVQGEGEFCIDARRLVELLREMPEQELRFSIDDSNFAIEITHPYGSYKFMGFDGNEFPHPTQNVHEAAKTFEVPAEALLRGLEYTAFAVGSDEVHPQMMGVYWDIKPDKIVFVATDSHKLVKFEDSSINPGFEGAFILPSKSTNVLRQVFNKEEMATVTINPEMGVTFSTASFLFDSRVIKGRFPPYDRVIRNDNPYALTLDRRLFITALRRVSHFVDEGHGLVKFRIDTDKLVLRASDNAYNSSGEETLSASFTGNNLVMGFSSAYLYELASVLWTEEIVFKLADPSRPAVIVPSENKPETELTMLLMPMSVTD